MVLVHPESQSVYHIEVSKTVGPYWLLVTVNALVKLGRSRDRSLPRSAGVQDNLEGIHKISRLMCKIWQKMLMGFLILRLE